MSNYASALEAIGGKIEPVLQEYATNYIAYNNSLKANLDASSEADAFNASANMLKGFMSTIYTTSLQLRSDTLAADSRRANYNKLLATETALKTKLSNVTVDPGNGIIMFHDSKDAYSQLYIRNWQMIASIIVVCTSIYYSFRNQ